MEDREENYLEDVLNPPRALQELVDRGLLAVVDGRARVRFRDGYDRVVIAGMGGGSLVALFPAFLACARAETPGWHLDAAEMLRDVHDLVTSRTLRCMGSQSGRSAEAVRFVDELDGTAGAVFATTNDGSSPLAESAAGAFRHGPMELAGRDLTLVAIGGEAPSRGLAERLAENISRPMAHVVWARPDPPRYATTTLSMPQIADELRDVAEIVPVQFHRAVLADRQDIPAGRPRIVEKVTVVE